MAFKALQFIYNDIPSEQFGLYLISMENQGVMSNVGSCSVELYTQEIYSRSKPYFYNAKPSPVLQFDLNFSSLKPIDAYTQSKIQQWLFGHNRPYKLQIFQQDMYNIYFNCILTNPVNTTVGNNLYSFKCTVICDAPWAWECVKYQVHDNVANNSVITFINESDDNNYMKPILQFTLGSYETSVSIKNLNDDDNGFTMTGLQPNETIYIDSDTCIIKSSTNLLRYDNFDGTHINFVPNINKLSINGNLSKLIICYQNARKIGG